MAQKLTASQEALQNFIEAEETSRPLARKAASGEQSARNIAAVTGQGAAQAGADAQNAAPTGTTRLGESVEKGTGTVLQVGEKAQEEAAKVTNWAGSLSTPGGILLLLVVLLVFVWVLVPVNDGMTRAQLFYLTLMGKTRIKGENGVIQPTTSQAAPPIGELAYVVPQGSATAQPSTTSVSVNDPYTQPGAIQALSNVNGTGYIPDFGASL